MHVRNALLSRHKQPKTLNLKPHWQVLERASDAHSALQDLRCVMAKGMPVTAEVVRVTCEWAASAPAALLAPALTGPGSGLARYDQASASGAAHDGQLGAEHAGPPELAAGRPGVALAAAAADEGGLAQRRAFAVALLSELASAVRSSSGSAHAAEAAAAAAAGPGSTGAPGVPGAPRSGTPDPSPSPKPAARPAAPPLQAALSEWLDGRAAGEAGSGAADPAGLGCGPAPAERALQALLVALTAGGLFCPAAYQGMLIARVRRSCIPFFWLPAAGLLFVAAVSRGPADRFACILKLSCLPARQGVLSPRCGPPPFAHP